MLEDGYFALSSPSLDLLSAYSLSREQRSSAKSLEFGMEAASGRVQDQGVAVEG